MLDAIKKLGSYEEIAYDHKGPAHLSIGQEAAAVGEALLLGLDDHIFGSHRSHGEIIAKGLSAIRRLTDEQSAVHINRLNHLLDRWEQVFGRQVAAATGQQPGSPPPSGQAAQNALVSRIIDEVVSAANSTSDFNNQLRYLDDFGVSGLGSGVFRALTGALPDWAPAEGPTAPGTDPQPLSGPAETMRKVIDLSEHPEEIKARFSELLASAVEEFNSGSLGRCVTVLDLAQRMLAEKEIDASDAKVVIEPAYHQLDQTRLREYADDKDRHILLRRVLDFFPPFQADQLFEDLMVEERRDRRRTILQLLTVHGETARARAFEILEGCIAGNDEQPWFVQRNLIYLLRSIPASEEYDIESEIDLLVRASVPGGQLPLLRECMTALGQIDHPRSQQTLIARISEFEDMLTAKGEELHNPTEIQSLLDTAIKALVRFKSSDGRACVVNHGLKRRPELGDTLARLALLGNQNLAEDRAAVNRILKALEAELPMKVLGMSVKTSRKNQNLEYMIESLSSTDTPVVRRAYEKIIRKYSGEQFANAAAKALTHLASKAESEDVVETDQETVTSLSGDLALFGLPNLMQNLADSRVEGILTVIDTAGNASATITLADGMMLDASIGGLEGETAVYQLLERPTTGRFVFVNQAVDADTLAKSQSGKSVMSLLMEGMRRYDEFNRAATIISDHAQYSGTGEQPTGLSDEKDADFVNGIWVLATKGKTPVEVEREIKVDSYRVFRLFEHWVNEGALQIASDHEPDDPDATALY
jgi:hypothetical protein